MRLPRTLVHPPAEVAAHGLDAIKDYWRQHRDSGIDYLAEAKLLIVGEPGAGKTTLAQKILDAGYQLVPTEESTEGIDVLRWQFPTAVRVTEDAGDRLIEQEFGVNVWDFGGQEIYHATHQFFLTKRSVYVLVCDERKEDTDFEYWLEVVDLLGKGSPLVIVQNCKQGRGQALDVAALRARFPNLVDAVAVDLADNSGLADAVAVVRRQLELLPHIGTALPKSWRDVRLALESDPRDHIPVEDFFAICEAHGFERRSDMLQLSGFLHDLGICLHFQDDPLLRKTVILKPDWGTGAVYRVLDDPKIRGALGTFGPHDLDRIWHEPIYADMRGELLQLMTRFALCYPVPGQLLHVAPQLLSPTRPTYDWDESENLLVRYEYDVMPKGIARRLIVALHDLIEGDHIWRSGAVFTSESGRAEVIEEYRRRRIHVRMAGVDPRVLLAVVDHELSRIHRSFPDLQVEKFLPCDCEGCAEVVEPGMYPLTDLKRFAEAGKQIQCRESTELVDAAALLADLFPQPRPASGAAPEVFISYKWGGAAEELVDEIQVVLTEQSVTVLRDKDEMRYRDSIDGFMRRLAAGRAVVVVIDRAYLESANCMFELTEIHRRGVADRVFPIVLPDADLSNPVTQLGYVKFWERKLAELEAGMREVSQDGLHGIREKLDLYRTIRTTIAGITTILADMNTLTADLHRGSGFAELRRALAPLLDEIHDSSRSARRRRRPTR